MSEAELLRRAAIAVRRRAVKDLPADMKTPTRLADWLDVMAAWIDEGLGTCADIGATNYPDAWSDAVEHAVEYAASLLERERAALTPTVGRDRQEEEQ